MEDFLIEHGLSVEDIGEALAMIDEIANAKAAAALAELLSRLGDSAAGIALKWVCLGDGEESIRRQASRVGVSHVAVLKAAKVVRKKLGLPVVDHM